MNSVAVVGGGTMGSGIAQVFAVHGHDVTLLEVSPDRVEAARQAMGRSLDRLVQKGKLDDAGRRSALGRVRGVTSTVEIGRPELVVEAVVEDLGVKREVFRSLDAVCPPGTVFATNTSSISVTELAAATKRPDRFVGMHFMNPVPVMELVEVIRGLATSDETCARVVALSRELGKTPVEVQDYPGFVSNRVLMPMINEAVYCLMEGVATREAIDQVMRLGMNHPMGPLQLADLIGLDVCLDIMNVLCAGYADSKYRPCPLLKKMVAAGYLGRKSGRGFYEYD